MSKLSMLPVSTRNMYNMVPASRSLGPPHRLYCQVSTGEYNKAALLRDGAALRLNKNSFYLKKTKTISLINQTKKDRKKCVIFEIKHWKLKYFLSEKKIGYRNGSFGMKLYRSSAKREVPYRTLIEA